MKIGLVEALRLHWNGDASLWRVFCYCPFLILLPCGFVIPLGIANEFLFANWFPNLGRFLLISTIAGTNALALWWCKGTIQKSLQMLSSSRLISAGPVFAIGFGMASWLLIEAFPLSYTSTREMIEESQIGRQSRQSTAEYWEKTPWTVIAQPELHRLVATGDLGWGSAKALKRAIEANPELHLLEVESYGGLVHEENLIVDLVRSHRMDTLILGKCASACTGVFLAGENRYVGPRARLGFHQSGYRGRAHDTRWATPEYESYILYYEQGVSKEFTDQALNTSYFSLWKPDVLDVKRSGFATNWWSERPDVYR